MIAKRGWWRTAVRPIAFVFLFGTLVGCSLPPNAPPGSASSSLLHARFVPDGSLRVGKVMYIGTREESTKVRYIYDTLTIAAGLPDDKIRDGTVVLIRVFCCGGPEEWGQGGLLVYVPEGKKAEVGDIIEVWSGRMSVKGDTGVPPPPNTMTRRVQQANSPNRRCRWMPDTPGLWRALLYCDWMPEEGWIQQDNFLFKFWIKPIAASSPPLGN